MKPLALALMAAVALAAGAPAAYAAAPAQAGTTSGEVVSAHYTGRAHTHYTKKKRSYARGGVYLHRGRWYRAPRTPRYVAPAWNANAGSYDAWHTKATWTPNGVPHAAHKAGGRHDYVLPEAKPRYSTSGKYIPTTYIYQETNGEFRIHTSGVGASGDAKDGDGKGKNPAAPGKPPAPPNPPSGARGPAAMPEEMKAMLNAFGGMANQAKQNGGTFKETTTITDTRTGTTTTTVTESKSSPSGGKK